MLHRDLAWFNGPLSPHLNALWFELFGVGLSTLAWANVALLTLFVALVYVLLLRLAGRLAAVAGGLVFLSSFAFGQQVGIGNYNWVCPYSHEATHGVLLAVASLVLLQTWRGTRSLAWVAAAGACTGLAALTKAEVFLGAAAGSAVALFALVASEPPRRRGRALLAFGLGALAPPLAAFVLLAGPLGAAGALRAVLGSWPYVLAGHAGDLAFYAAGMGLDDTARSLLRLAVWTAGWLAALLPAFGLAFAARQRTARSWVLAAALAIAELGLLAALPADVRWSEAPRPLPLAALASGAIWLAALARGRVEPARGAIALGLSALSLALLAKMILNARLQNYGFALALPASLLTVAALAGWIPRWLERRGRAGVVLAAASIALGAAAGRHHWLKTESFVRRKTELVGTGPDAFRADLRGRFVRETLEQLERILPKDATLAVLPEGATLNYLSRRRNPTPYVNFMPPELLMFGEQAMLDAFLARPPDAVVLVHKDTSEYGLPLFGRDYGRALMEWVRREYEPRATLGDPPLQPGARLGVQILLRRE